MIITKPIPMSITATPAGADMIIRITIPMSTTATPAGADMIIRITIPMSTITATPAGADTTRNTVLMIPILSGIFPQDTSAGSILLKTLAAPTARQRWKHRSGSFRVWPKYPLHLPPRQLRITAKDPDSLLPRMQEICSSIESQVKLVPRKRSSGNFITRTYLLDHVDCANCAAKMESRINDLPEILEATVTFATKQLRVTAKDPDSLIPEMLRICRTIEPDVTITPKERPVRAAASSREDSPSRKKSFWENYKKEILSIGIGALLFIAGEILGHLDQNLAALAVLVLGYVILGGRVVSHRRPEYFQGSGL